MQPQIFLTISLIVSLQITRGGVLENVLGLEDTFWSHWPGSLKSSKIALSSAQGQHYFWTVQISLKNARNLGENLQTFFWVPSRRDRLKKNVWRPFFFENTRVCVLGFWPWPREGLSLASKFFCVLGLEPCVLDSTSANYIWVRPQVLGLH